MGQDSSVVEETSRFRHSGWKAVEAWLIISDDGYGNPVGIAEDNQIWLADHNGELLVLASCFEEFVLKVLEGRVFT